jgi:hypothetical protein
LHLAKELALCDPGRPEATTCTPFDQADPNASDECGCNALDCGAGKTCVSLEQVCACDPKRRNVCVDSRCETNADCPAPQVCTPGAYILGGGASPENRGRCMTPLCTADADCTDDVGGRCGLVIGGAAVSGEPFIEAIRCIYDGGSSAPPGGCRGTTPRVIADAHTCPELAH